MCRPGPQQPARTKAALLCLALHGLLASVGARADEALIAVAANFAEPLERLEAEFERQSAHRLTVTAASTGLLYAQIESGAPFDAFLAADEARPALLEDNGRAVKDSRFTYAIGRLTLWSADPGFIAADGAETLRRRAFRNLAIANPALAPYGRATRETLQALGLVERLQDKIVMGENIGQAHAMVATGNAELGFVALSSVVRLRREGAGSRWDVPQDLYGPIRQDAVLLARAADNDAARDFLAYLKRADAKRIIRDFGYRVE